MSTLTIRVPEGKHRRLRNLANARGVSVNRLIDELAAVALTEYDSETRFGAMAARGSKEPVWLFSLSSTGALRRTESHCAG